jgi:hypothetical protein
MGVDNITKASTMQEVLKAFPGAQRALFSRYHIGRVQPLWVRPDRDAGTG